MSMHGYQYVVLRCVPRVEREEFLNVGVVVYCQSADFLDVAWHCDAERLAALGPELTREGQALSERLANDALPAA